MNITITESGTQPIINKLSDFIKKYPLVAANILKEEAEHIITESKLEVPVDTGSLKDSNYIKDPVINSSNISITLGYGGNNVKINPKSGQATNVYAIEVHENTRNSHRTGKAKFLIDPIERNVSRLTQRLRNSIDALL